MLGWSPLLEESPATRSYRSRCLSHSVNSNLIDWLKGWAVIPSLSVLKGYNKHKNGFPKMTLSVMFLTRTNLVIKDMPPWQTSACGMS